MLARLLNFLPRLPHREDNLFAILFLMLLIGPLFFLPIVTDAFGPPRFALFIILTGFTLLIFAFRGVYLLRFNRWFLISLLGFLFFSTFSVIFSADLIYSIIGNYRQANSILFILLWVLLIFFLGLALSKDRILSVMRMLIFSGFLVAIVGVLHYFGLGIYVQDVVNSRPITPGLIGNQNFSALFIVGVLPLIFPVFKSSKNFYSRVYYLVSGFAMITSLSIFASRGAILSLGIGLLIAMVLIFLHKRTIFTKGIVIGMLASLMLMSSLFYTSARIMEVQNSLTFSDSSGQNRITAWLNASEIISKSPLYGIGFGNFIFGYKSLGSDSTNSGGQFDDAHNIFLQLGATAGIPTMLFFCFVSLSAIFTSYRGYKNSLSEQESLINLAILVGLVSVLVGMSFTPVDISNWILLAFLFTASQYTQRSIDLKKLTIALQNFYVKSFVVVIGFALVVVGSMYMASVIIHQGAYNNYLSKNYEDSERGFRTVLLLNPLETSSKAYIASMMIKRQADPSQIRPVIEEYIYAHPNDPETHYTGSYLYFMLHENTKDKYDLSKSLAHIEIYNEKHPNFAPAMLRKAYLYYKSGLIDEAQITLQNAATLVTAGQNYYGYLLLAQIQLEKGELEAVIKSLEKAYELQNSAALKYLIEIIKSGEYNQKTLPIGFPPVDIT